MTAAPPTRIESAVGARLVCDSGFAGCVELTNATTRIVLEPNVGGRVLSYAWQGVEALYRNPAENGLRWDGTNRLPHPAGGRFDLGPEYGGLLRDALWFGRWTAEIVGPRSAVLTSALLAASGVQVRRRFTLAAESSELRCTQIIRNHGAESVRTFHWGRTFVPSGGIAFAPLPAQGRFPCGYALGGPAETIDFTPSPEPNVRIREGILEIVGAPGKAKFVLDVQPGWLAYLARNGLLFIKRFPVYPNRPYGELAANNASIWYGAAGNTPTWPFAEHAVELEPIGPLEWLAPGGQCKFTEDWSLSTFDCPSADLADLNRLREVVAAAGTAEGFHDA